MKIRFALVALTLAAALPRARADEGMWTFNNVPMAKLKARYGFTPDSKWLDHVRLSSARLAQGCSASFVSASGLVMTNHHCAHHCIEQLSTAQRDYVASGFYAATVADEVKCPELEANQLVAISDVTARINGATRGLSDQKYNEAEKAESSRIEKECAGAGKDADKVRCDVVSLYHGGSYNLYKYRRYQDVRLVFAPEFAMAFFGGDPDNFNFPRYDLDVSFLRVYDEGKPAHMDDFLPWSPAGAKEGELTFVSGNPGGTSRLLTVAELEYLRDVALPDRLMSLAQLRGLLTEYQHRGAEEKRTANALLFYVENGFKALRGREEALVDANFFKSKISEENALRSKIAKNSEWKKTYGNAWDAIARAETDLRALRKPLIYIEQGSSFMSDEFQFARTLVRGADERIKPNEKRFREFADSRLPAVTQALFSPAPIYDEFEIFKLTFSLTHVREELGADHPFIKEVLGKKSPEELATELVKGTKLREVAERKRLWEGGKAAIDASTDPMIVLARRIDGEARAVRKRYEDGIESVIKKNSELIARARFAIDGTKTYPDATFTPRLSYGAVKGYLENGHEVKPFTTFAGAFERATGREPFKLPESWEKARSALDLKTPFDFCTTNDIIGGNSGSPVINRAGQAVGLVFDGNIQSLGGDYGFDESVNRTVAVDSEAIIQALGRIYHADRIASELRP